MGRCRNTKKIGVDGSGWQQQQQQQRPQSRRQEFRYGGHGRPVVGELEMVATSGRVRQGEGAERGIAVYDGENDDGEELEVRAGCLLCWSVGLHPVLALQVLVTVVSTKRSPMHL